MPGWGCGVGKSRTGHGNATNPVLLAGLRLAEGSATVGGGFGMCPCWGLGRGSASQLRFAPSKDEPRGCGHAGCQSSATSGTLATSHVQRALSAWLCSAPSCVQRDAGQERPLSVRQVQAANYLLKPDVLAQSCHEEFQGAPVLGGPALKSLPFHRGGKKRPGLPGEECCPKPNAAASSSRGTQTGAVRSSSRLREI